MHRVLLLGADDDARRALHVMLARAGLHVAAVSGLGEARSYLAAGPCDLVIAVGELAGSLVGDRAGPPVVAVVRSRDVGQAVALLAAGVDDVVSEPIDDLALALLLRRVPMAARPRGAAPAVKPALIGDGEAMQRLRELIARAAPTRATVLVLGESGTGKELVARAIHDGSPRSGRRFVAVNCAAIPEALLESELFGHCRGAFTDALRDKPGLFEDADGGTLFLDEIGELPLALQAKLLRALQDGEIRRVGDTASVKVDVRLIAATLRDLAEEVRTGGFREDLYYRLNVVALTLPPLRERAEDIPQLARFFARRAAERHQLGEVALTDAALAALARQPWPGNVRELENAIERAVVLADAPPAGGPRWIDYTALPFGSAAGRVRAPAGDHTARPFGGAAGRVRAPATDADAADAAPPPDAAPAAAEPSELSIKKATRELEQALIRRALVLTQGNRTNAAKLLEISHRALLYKMKDYGIS